MKTNILKICTLAIFLVIQFNVFGENCQNTIVKHEAAGPVEAKKKITELVGEIEITEVTKSGTPTISKPDTEKSFSESFATSPLNITILDERIKQINKSKEVLARALSETDKFEIAIGKTPIDVNGMPGMVKSEATSDVYGKCEDKWVLTRSERIKGTSNGQDILITISLERGVETDNLTISSLSPRYCLTIHGSNVRLLFGKYKTTGKISGQKRDYPCDELKDFEEEYNSKSELPAGGMTSTIGVNGTEANEVIIPLSIPNSKVLEGYLLNPVGSYTINVSGKYIKKDYKEIEITIHAKLTLMPKE